MNVAERHREFSVAERRVTPANRRRNRALNDLIFIFTVLFFILFQFFIRLFQKSQPAGIVAEKKPGVFKKS
jgi:hypothetical protein